jgi:hypothetical protein
VGDETEVKGVELQLECRMNKSRGQMCRVRTTVNNIALHTENGIVYIIG